LRRAASVARLFVLSGQLLPLWRSRYPSLKTETETHVKTRNVGHPAEGLVVKSLAKAKLQFPMMTEKFE